MKAARVLDLEADDRRGDDADRDERAYAPNFIAVAEGLAAGEVIDLARHNGLRHLVQKDGVAFDAELALAKLMVGAPLIFFDDPILAMIGAPELGKDPGFVFRSAHDAKKTDFLAAFEAYVTGLSGGRRVREEAMMMADELFTNGSKHAYPTRKLSLAKSTGEIEFQARSDGERMAISCTDTFGLLDVQNPLNRIAKCMENGVATSIQNGPGGAGIGSFLVFNAAVSYCLAVERGKRSTVAVALALDARLREGEAVSKNLHILTVGR